MTIIKCKMCGGDIELAADKTYGMCDFCGSTMTLPKIDDDQWAAAFNRGNHFRRIGEFDKALAVYERIVREDESDAEAHWCCALCRFGIEYVEDPATYEYLPTCHRASFDSFLEDVDYLAAVEHSEGITRRQYQKDAAKIAEVQRGILATSQNAEPYDVFICYKESDANGDRTRDSLMAQDIYYQLTEQGRKVFFARITLEDVAGTQYEPYIFAALNSAKVMIVIGTKPEHLNAVWVKNEWSRFLAMMKKDRHKLLLPCYRDMDPYDMPEALSVLQSYDMAKIGFLQDLTRGISKVLDADKKPEPAKETVVVQQTGGTNANALLKRGYMSLEDGDWKKADEFFEEVLNQDAECAEAYIGKTLSLQKCQDLNVLVKQWQACYDETYQKSLSFPEDTDRVQKSIAQYQVPGFLSRDEIRNIYSISLNYPSEVKCCTEQRDNAKEVWNTHKLLTKAARFAQGETKKQLEDAREAYFSAMEDRIVRAKQQEAAGEAACRAQYEQHLTQADASVEALYRDALKQRDKVYEICVREYLTSDVLGLVRQAEKELLSMGNYLESEALLQQCRERIALLEEKGRKEKEEAEARKKAAVLAQQQAYAAALERQRKKRIITLSTVAACILFLVLLFTVIIPSIRYSKASKLLEAGQYQEAADLFTLLDDYRNSQTMAREANYLRGNHLAKEGQYGEAILCFQQLGEYKDSFDRILECKYQIAEVLFAEGKYEEALAAFTDLTDYSDAPERVQQAKDAISDIAYQAAEKALAAGDDYLAATLFGKAGNYKDAWTRCRTLWDAYTVHNTLCADGFAVYALRENGTVAVADGGYACTSESENEIIRGWTQITAITHGANFFAGLREDGTVALEGDDTVKEAVSQWTGIVDIAGTYETLYALRSDGTVISTKSNGVALEKNITRLAWCGDGLTLPHRDGSYTYYSRFDSKMDLEAKGWTDVVTLHTGNAGDVALRSDGTVLYERNSAVTDPTDFSGATKWKNIVAISADSEQLLGLKADGTVVAVGDNDYSRTTVGSWTNIAALETSLFNSVGLRSDGTLVCTNKDVKSALIWKDIRLPE